MIILVTDGRSAYSCDDNDYHRFGHVARGSRSHNTGKTVKLSFNDTSSEPDGAEDGEELVILHFISSVPLLQLTDGKKGANNLFS